MIKKKIIGILTTSNNYNDIFNLNKKIYNDLIIKFNHIYIINLKNLLFIKPIKNRKKIKKDLNKKIKYFEPKNISEFTEFFKNTKLIGFNCFGKSLNFFKIYYHLNKIDFSQILLLNIGYPQNIVGISYNKKKDFFFSLIFFLNRFFSKKLFRILTFLNIFPKIDYYFDTRKEIIRNINNSFLKKIEKNFPIFNLSYFKIAHLVNSRSYDDSLNFKKYSNKYITFVDSPFLDPDRIVREGKIENFKVLKYYEILNQLFFKLKKIFKKEIIICAHPGNNLKKLKKSFPNFKVFKFKTLNYIQKSDLVLFHESSAALDAVILNKKLVTLESCLLGEYYSKRILFYKNNMGINSLNLDDDPKIDKKKFLKKFTKSKKTIKYIKDNLKADGNNPGYKKVLKIINDIYNLN
jgi:hypothetical protein